MIDIHCHILPDFDDGAADLAESMAMARMAVDSGVTGIVVTPHFRGESQSLELLPRLVSRYDRFVRAVDQAQLPLYLYPGAEVLCLPETPELARRGHLPTIGNTRYLLTEFFFNEAPAYMNEMLYTLESLGYRIVVAHPERYEAVQQAPGLLEEWFGRGYVLQLNKGSLLGAFGPKIERLSHWMLQSGFVHLVASDAHGIKRRTPEMAVLRQHISEICPPAYAQVLLEQNPQLLVQGKPMVPAK